MNLWTGLQVLAATSSLMVAGLALSKGPPSPLRLPLALLAVESFVFNVSSVSLALSGDVRYRWIGTIVSPLFVPLLFHFVLLFVGRARALRWLLAACYALFLGQALLALVDFLVPALELPGGLMGYRVMRLGLIVPVAAIGLLQAVLYLRSVNTPQERFRGRLLLTAILIATCVLPTDWVAALGAPVPALAPVGSLAINLILTQLVLGVGMVPGQRKNYLALAVLASLLVVSVYVALFIGFGEHQSLLLITVTAVTLGLAALGRLTLVSWVRAREALERHATLGRFAAQMAHDLRNPLSAALGAAELLARDLGARQDAKDAHLAVLLVQQLGRLHEIIDRYQRLSKVELSVREVDLNQLVARVLSLQGFATPEAVTVRSVLSPACRPIKGDPELLASALENLVRNAFEATAHQGVVTVTTHASPELVRVAVQDTGAGMNARTLEQAFIPFFTTKATGSGLGLAFVRQVARAHGGDARITSTEGAGTTVEISLPLVAGGFARG